MAVDDVKCNGERIIELLLKGKIICQKCAVFSHNENESLASLNCIHNIFVLRNFNGQRN